MTEAITPRSAKPLTPEEAAELLVPLWTPEETAKYLGLDPDTLAIWRCTKRYGLPYIHVGSRIMYDPVEVRKWQASRTTGPDGVTPKCVRRRRGGPGKPVGGWPSQRKKKAGRSA